MAAPVLVTKLYRPPPRPEAVPRPRLIAQLDEGLRGRLTLVSAPAGSGKTTLVGAWVAGCGRPSAWLSLDEGDSDLARFLSYLVAALRTSGATIGEGVLAVLQSPQPPPTEALLTALLNEVAALRDEIVLVLDDYHVIEAEPVDRALAFLVEHLPPRLHLVIATREDPPLPLARLRARGHRSELRAADLRFTPVEAAEFLNPVMGLNLSAADVAALETRTEGWIAGLQLAALSLRGQRDVGGFIASFTGSHRFVLDYLVEEVLQRQPASVQAFLLHTSILDRLCGPLCDAVLRDHAASGQATLEYLERANLFLVPLDDERRWFRYHHLFAELLRQRLREGGVSSARDWPGEVTELHRRASQWYEDHGLEVEAFQHAAAAGDIERAERLIEGAGMPLYFRGPRVALLTWLRSLPATVLAARPALWVAYVTLLTFAGEQTVEQQLHAAEAALHDAEPGEKTRNLSGHIAALRAMLAVPQHEIETIIAQAGRALEFLHRDNLPMRTLATWTLGYAYQLRGDHAAASRAFTDAITISQASGNVFMTILATGGLGQVQEAENQLYPAAESYRRVLHLVGEPPLPIAGEAYLGLARVLYQWNDLEAAHRHAQQCLQLTPQMESVDTFASLGVLLARLRLARDDLPGAVAILADAEAFRKRPVHQGLSQVVEGCGAQRATPAHHLERHQAERESSTRRERARRASRGRVRGEEQRAEGDEEQRVERLDQDHQCDERGGVGRAPVPQQPGRRQRCAEQDQLGVPAQRRGEHIPGGDDQPEPAGGAAAGAQPERGEGGDRQRHQRAERDGADAEVSQQQGQGRRVEVRPRLLPRAELRARQRPPLGERGRAPDGGVLRVEPPPDRPGLLRRALRRRPARHRGRRALVGEEVDRALALPRESYHDEPLRHEPQREARPVQQLPPRARGAA